MKYLNIIVVLSIFLALASCGTRVVEKPVPERHPIVDTGDQIFHRAEMKFNAKEYGEALRLYSRYLERYPDGALAPAALLKKGAVLSAKGEYGRAREAYLKLIDTWPGEIYTSDAMVEVLVTYLNEERFQEVVTYGHTIPDDLKPEDYRVRKYNVMGDAFRALDAPVDAVESYVKAWQPAGDVEKAGLRPKLAVAVSMLSGDEAAGMLDRTVETGLRGYLLFRIYKSYAEAGQIEEAIKGITDFLGRYPDHPVAGDALLFKNQLLNADFNPLLVGCLIPLSGKYEKHGVKVQMGVDLAYSVFSRTRGNTGLEIIYRDTESDPDVTRRAVKELAEAGVAAIVGPVGTVEAAAEEAQLRGVPIITLTGKEKITTIGDYVFRNFITKKMQVTSVVGYAFEVLGLNNFAILYPDEAYGRTFMDLFWDEVHKYGGEIVGAESYGVKDTDFAKPIRKLTGLYYPRPKEPSVPESENGNGEGDGLDVPDEPRAIVDFDAIFIPDSSPKVGLILPQLSFNDVGDVYYLGTNLWHTDRLLHMAGRDAGDTVIPDAFFSGSSDPTVKRFVREFKKFYLMEPKFLEAFSYDSAMIIFEILAKGGVTSSFEVRDRLLELNDFKGVTGLTSFDETGDAVKDLYLLKANGRRFKELEK